MKPIACMLLSIVLLFSLAACAHPADGSDSNAFSDASLSLSRSAEEQTQPASGEKTLVVYFSATGSTKAVAETIADYLHADRFELVPQHPYTREDLDWTDPNSRVSIEHNDEQKREVPLTANTPGHWEQYDTIYIGYPIWWGIAAWPVDGFLKANDFTGKTVIPFCTSASSGIGNSDELLKDAAGTGTWRAGKRFSSHASEADITDWLS